MNANASNRVKPKFKNELCRRKKAQDLKMGIMKEGSTGRCAKFNSHASSPQKILHEDV